MAGYNRLLSKRVAAYASEINRLKALVAKLQHMQFGKSSEKLREKTQRQVREAEERINAQQEELAETLGEQHDPALPLPLPLPLPYRAKHACSLRKKVPARRVAVASVRSGVISRNNWSSSAAPSRLSKHSGRS